MGEKEKIIKWLDTLVMVYRVSMDNQKYNEKVKVCSSNDRIHLTEATSVCETAGIIPVIQEWECEGSTARQVSFQHCGVLFFALEDYEEWEGEKENVPV